MNSNLTHGFRLIQEQDIGELRTGASLYRHEKTGAELLSLVNDDENKVFGITFRTPPTDSTGVAHILEHSVLCGSRKYPVKEPFVELLKGSLQTFLNAFTYPDKTCYPVASQNRQDFYNLIDVYLDAVFYPRLTPHVLQQEGWHHELDADSSPLTFKGVVFNEMKGAYASPDNLLSRYSLQSLFPETPYRHDSGGDPEVIPQLTFDRFMAFHRTYYHPSNARIFFYGDDDPESRLELIHAYLSEFDALTVASDIPPQPPIAGPLYVTKPFMAGDAAVAKGMVTLNWLLPETLDLDANFSLRFLEYILLGMPASPLRKALIDSGLGEDLAGGGLETELRQMFFSTGLKGIRTGDAQQVENLTLDTLTGLAQTGIHPHTVEAAVNTIEFRFRENNAGHFPRGLLLMLRALTTWLYNGDPMSLLAFESPLAKVKRAIASDKGFFQDMIRRSFVDNPHRTTLMLEPDRELQARVEAGEKARLSEARARMDSRELKEIVDNTRELKRRQAAPDSAEALAAIPTLKMSDLDKKNKILPLLSDQEAGVTTLYHDVFTNDIAYLDVGFDLQALKGELIPYVPLFGRALVEMGTETEDYVSLTQRISRQTGGIRPQTFTSAVKNADRSAAWLFLRGKAVASRVSALTQILQDVLGGVRLDNPERFRQMVMEEKARMEERLVPSGHQMVNLRLRAHFNDAHWCAEQMGGVAYLLFLRRLADRVDADWSAVLSVLEEIRGTLINRGAAILNLTLDEGGWKRAIPCLQDIVGVLPERDLDRKGWSRAEQPFFEGMTIPSQVNYVGKAGNLYDLGYRFHGSALVITRYLRNAWLWDRVRVQGGAYGAFCLFDKISGVLSMVSYRDPNVFPTLEAFDQAAGFLMDRPVGEDELTKSIIGATGDMDAYLLPDAKGYASMIRYLINDTDKDRQKMRDEVLGTGEADFKAFGELLSRVKEAGIVKVLGSARAIKDTNDARNGWLEVLNVL